MITAGTIFFKIVSSAPKDVSQRELFRHVVAVVRAHGWDLSFGTLRDYRRAIQRIFRARAKRHG